MAATATFNDTHLTIDTYAEFVAEYPKPDRVGTWAYIQETGDLFVGEMDENDEDLFWLKVICGDVGLAAVDLYVSTTGSDTTGDGTSTDPFATIGRALEEAVDCGFASSVNIHLAPGGYSITDLNFPEGLRVALLGSYATVTGLGNLAAQAGSAGPLVNTNQTFAGDLASTGYFLQLAGQANRIVAVWRNTTGGPADSITTAPPATLVEDDLFSVVQPAVTIGGTNFKLAGIVGIQACRLTIEGEVRSGVSLYLDGCDVTGSMLTAATGAGLFMYGLSNANIYNHPAPFVGIGSVQDLPSHVNNTELAISNGSVMVAGLTLRGVEDLPPLRISGGSRAELYAVDSLNQRILAEDSALNISVVPGYPSNRVSQDAPYGNADGISLFRSTANLDGANVSECDGWRTGILVDEGSAATVGGWVDPGGGSNNVDYGMDIRRASVVKVVNTTNTLSGAAGEVKNGNSAVATWAVVKTAAGDTDLVQLCRVSD